MAWLNKNILMKLKLKLSNCHKKGGLLPDFNLPFTVLLNS